MAFNLADMGQPDRVTGSSRKAGGIEIWFGNGYKKRIYNVHSVSKMGTEDDADGSFTAWGWRKHLQHKRWYSTSLDEEFLRELKKYL